MAPGLYSPLGFQGKRRPGDDLTLHEFQETVVQFCVIKAFRIVIGSQEKQRATFYKLHLLNKRSREFT